MSDWKTEQTTKCNMNTPTSKRRITRISEAKTAKQLSASLVPFQLVYASTSLSPFFPSCSTEMWQRVHVLECNLNLPQTTLWVSKDRSFSTARLGWSKAHLETTSPDVHLPVPALFLTKPVKYYFFLAHIARNHGHNCILIPFWPGPAGRATIQVQDAQWWNSLPTSVKGIWQLFPVLWVSEEHYKKSMPIEMPLEISIHCQHFSTPF